MKLIKVAGLALISSAVLAGTVLSQNTAQARSNVFQSNQVCDGTPIKTFGLGGNKKIALAAAVRRWNRAKPFGYLAYRGAADKFVSYQWRNGHGGHWRARTKATPCRTVLR